jgi:hypothetical protein
MIPQFMTTKFKYILIKNNFLRVKLSPFFINFAIIKNTILLKKDKIKTIVIAILISLLASSFFIFGKDSSEMKYVSGFCLLTWLGTMFFVNKKYS